MPERTPRFADSVFLNCPFDQDYWPLFEALVFCVVDCDIAGQDIRPHSNSPDVVINAVRNWLRRSSKRTSIPGPMAIKKRFARFSSVIPQYCDRLDLDRDDIQFTEYVTMIEEWLRSA